MSRDDRRERFHTTDRSLPSAWSPGDESRATAMNVYFDGDEKFVLGLDAPGGVDIKLWTTEAGLRELIEACHVALTRDIVLARKREGNEPEDDEQERKRLSDAAAAAEDFHVEDDGGDEEMAA